MVESTQSQKPTDNWMSLTEETATNLSQKLTEFLAHGKCQAPPNAFRVGIVKIESY